MEETDNAFAEKVWEAAAMDDARALDRLFISDTPAGASRTTLSFSLPDAAITAVMHGACNCLDWLGRNLLDLSGPLPQGGNLLHILAANDGVAEEVAVAEEVSALLLEAGASPHCQDASGWTPLLMAAADHRPGLLRPFLAPQAKAPSGRALAPELFSVPLSRHDARRLDSCMSDWRMRHPDTPASVDPCLLALLSAPPPEISRGSRTPEKDLAETMELLRPPPEKQAALVAAWLAATTCPDGPPPRLSAWKILLQEPYRQHLPEDTMDRLVAARPARLLAHLDMWMAGLDAGLAPAAPHDFYRRLLTACLHDLTKGRRQPSEVFTRPVRAFAARLHPPGWNAVAAACSMPDGFADWTRWVSGHYARKTLSERALALHEAMLLAAAPSAPRRRLRA